MDSALRGAESGIRLRELSRENLLLQCSLLRLPGDAEVAESSVRFGSDDHVGEGASVVKAGRNLFAGGRHLDRVGIDHPLLISDCQLCGLADPVIDTEDVTVRSPPGKGETRPARKPHHLGLGGS